jgi:hypothetical protein
VLRKPRFTLPGVPQHVIQRGNNRESYFLAEQDYRRDLEDLAAMAEKSDDMDEAKLHEIRDALDHELVLGRSCFKDKIEAMTYRQTRLHTRPAACGRRGRGVLHRLVDQWKILSDPGFAVLAEHCV